MSWRRLTNSWIAGVIVFGLSALNGQADTLVTWTNSKLNDDGVLEAAVVKDSRVEITARPSLFHDALQSSKDGVRQITGNSVVYFLPVGVTAPTSIEEAVKADHYAEVNFQVDGLQDGSTLTVHELSCEIRPNSQRVAGVHGATLSQLAIGSQLIGSVGSHKVGSVSQSKCSGLNLALENGDGFTARIYLAGFDNHPEGSGKFNDFHLGVRLGNIVVSGEITGAPPELTTYPPAVARILENRCFHCHGADDQSADIRFDTLSIDLAGNRRAAETWHDALHVLQRGEMPPDDETDLSTEERQTLTSWIRSKIDSAVEAGRKRSNGVVMRRLNNAEYRFTISDLLGIEGDFGTTLPADPLSKEGFANDGSTLGMTALQLETYLADAREAFKRVLFEGDRPERYSQTETVSVKKSDIGNGYGETSQSLGRTGVFGMTVADPPLEHDFVIRVTAKVDRLPGKPLPRMQLVYGHKAPGAVAMAELVGKIDLTSDDAVTYEFRGNGQDFPNAKLVGEKWNQIIVVKNVLDDGRSGPKPVPVKEGSRKKVVPVDPEFPKIEIESVEFVGNDYDSWPPSRHRRILFEADDEGSPEYVRQVLQRFLNRAWRRPVSEAEVARYQRHFDMLNEQLSFVAAMRETLAVALASPHFLYLVEPRSTEDARLPLNEYEFASRLSCFLWSSMPDDELAKLAASGELSNPDTIGIQVSRMLGDPKSQRFIEQFTRQWLDLDGLERVAVNPQFYPDFDNDLKADMIGETQAFFTEILRSESSAMQFIDADWTMLNAALASHYGIDGPQSQNFERVELDESMRPGGLLGHASMHLSNSNGEDSHPIKRAIWIRERLLHDPPLPPPPNVPALDDTDPNFAKLSIREQLSIHRKDPACADCHRNIDGWGVALDHYDAVGLWRDEIRRPSGKKRNGEPVFDRLPVDATDSLPGKVTLTGVDSLKTHLIQDRREQFVRAFVTKLLTYALGRSIEWYEEESVEQLAEQFEASDYKISSLIQAIVASKLFRQP